MATALPLDESAVKGDPDHPRKHSDEAYYINRLAELVGLGGMGPASATTTLLSATQAGDLLARFLVRADGTIAMGGAPLAVSTVAGTTTVTVTTTTDHGYGTGDVVTIAGVAGHVGANGSHTITRTSATAFTLDGVTGSGTYTSGGTVQRLLGTSGSANEGVWNLVVPAGENTRYGLVVRLNTTSLKAGFKVVDAGAADIFAVLPHGGAGVISADPTDGLWVSEDTSGRSAFVNTGGGARFAYGDPGGGLEVLALGNATTQPSSNPDGSHTAESGFDTEPGVVGWSRDGRLRLRTSAGHEDELLHPVHRHVASLSAPGGDTPLVVTGTLPPTVASASLTITADDQAGGPLVKYATPATSGVDAGVVTPLGVVQRRWAPHFYCRLMTDASAVTSTRLWVGLTSAELGALAANPTTQHVAAVRYDTGLDGTAFWRFVTAGGSAATVTTTTVAVAANTSYEVAVEVNAAGTSVRCWINGTLAATHTTNLPGASTALGCTARLRTLAAASRALRLGRMTWSTL